MVIDIILVAVGLIGLLIGTITDFKSREVPDYLNYFLITSGLGLRLIYSLITNDWMFLAYGAIGALSCTALAFIMFYSGQWGGGDTKLLIGMGALFGSYPVYFLNFFSPNLKFFFITALILNIFLAGAIFGIIFTLYLAVKNWKKFFTSFNNFMKHRQITIARRIILVSATLTIILLLFVPDPLLKFAGAVIVVLSVLTFHAWIGVKAVEDACMFKQLKVSKLVEGDWVAEEVKVDKKVIYTPNKTGIELDDIDRLKKNNIKSVLVKEGIPFVPSFLAGFIITFIWGNILLTILGI